MTLCEWRVMCECVVYGGGWITCVVVLSFLFALKPESESVACSQDVVVHMLSPCEQTSYMAILS